MPEQFLIDPTAEGTGTELDLMAAPYAVLAYSAPAPPLELASAGSIDTEGDIPGARRHQNRAVTVTVNVDPTTRNQVNLDAALYALERKVAKIAREGGTLRRVRADGSYRTLDLLAADTYEPAFDIQMDVGFVATVQIGLLAEPYARGAAQTLSSHAETSLPVNVFTETGIQGDVPALGRLIVTDAQAVSQSWAAWGLESKNYSSSANAALFYQAEGRTAMGGSATAVGTSGASGAGSNVMKNTSLGVTFSAVLSTQATGGGAHLSHVGSFRVLARVLAPTANTGDISVAFQWGQGDFNRPAQNTTVLLDTGQEGTWQLVDLGVVTLTTVIAGTQKWEGRLLAKSSVAGDDIEVDWLMLVPTDEGSGEAVAVIRPFTPTSFSARDNFAVGTLGTAVTGTTLPVGGTWAGAGDTDDFKLGAAGKTPLTSYAQRTPTGADADINTGRYLIAGTATFTDVGVHADTYTSVPLSAGIQHAGVLARYTDTSNWAMAVIVYDPAYGTGFLMVRKRVAGTATTLYQKPLGAGVYNSLQFVVRSNGQWEAVVSGNMTGTATGFDSVFATGGTLATGKTGLYGYNNTATTTSAVTIGNFWVAVPPSDASIYASQSLEFRHDGTYREDSSGAVWTTASKYEGDNIRVPVAGPEGRTTRFIVKASRFYPFGPDSGTDDLTAQLVYTPRFLGFL